MTQFAPPLPRLRAFLREERAGISVETAVVLPFLALVYLQGFTYFDAYRAKSQLTKAGYSIADLVSRRDVALSPDDIEGLQDVFGYITGTQGRNWMRMTELSMGPNNELDVTWSYSTDRNPELANSYIPRVENRLPPLDEGERVLLVETYTRYEPAFNVGLPKRVIETFTPVRSRWGGQIRCPDC